MTYSVSSFIESGTVYPVAQTFDCEYCPESFSVSKALNVHVQRVHVKVPEETEIKLHNAEEHFVCPHCPKKYERVNSLQVHLYRIHRDTPRRTAEELRRSGGTDYNDKEQVEKPVIEEPMKRGRGRPPLVKPQKDTFTPPAAVDPLKCNMCNKSFATVDFLQKHKLTHTLVDLTKLYCDVCGQIFKRPQYVARHKKISACGGTIKMETESPSNEDNVPSTASRKRSHEETSDNIDQECSVNESMDMSLPKTKQLLMKEDHMIKTEQNDSYEGDHENEPMRPESSDREADRMEEEKRINKLQEREKALQIKKDEKLARLLQRMFEDELLNDEDDQSNDDTAVGRRSKLRQSLNVKKEIPSTPENKDVGNRSMVAEVGSPRSQEFSDSEETTTSTVALNHVPARNTTHTSTVTQRLESLQNEVPTGWSNVEYSSLPLIAAMCGRAAKELLVVWNPTINEDLLLMVINKASNIIVCVHSTEVMNMSPQERELWKHTHQTQFYIMTSNGKATSWTAMAFSAKLLPETLRNSFYYQIQKAEAEFRQMADSLQMEMINLVKFGSEGLFPVLSTSFVNKMIATNCRQ